MHCLLVISAGPEAWTSAAGERRERFELGPAEPGEVLSAAVLAGPADAKTVRVRNGIRAVTDGPCAEFTEFLAGYYLIVCETLERATDLAATVRDTRSTAVEVRPLMHHAGLEM
jgi:hypothetical protein